MFENLIGNNNIKEYLKKCIIDKNYSHSYMFFGPEGVGKKLFAKSFSEQILCLDINKNCEKYAQTENEKKCDSCIKFDSGNHPDFEIIEPDGKSIKIDQIRSLQQDMANKPIISKNKIFIINDADTMTEESQNCLLKTLEEPPKYGIIFLIVSNESKILPTIKSRCVTLKFNKIEKEEMKKSFPDLSEEQIELLDGSLKQKDTIKEKEEEYKSLIEFTDNLDKGIPYLMNNTKILYDGKNNINELLDYLNIILLNKKMFNGIEYVEKTKRKLQLNNNYEMCIDYLIINLYKCKNNKNHC